MFDFVALSSEKLGYFEFKVVVIYLICLDLPFRSSLKFSYGVFNMLNLYFFPLMVTVSVLLSCFPFASQRPD